MSIPCLQAHDECPVFFFLSSFDMDGETVNVVGQRDRCMSKGIDSYNSHFAICPCVKRSVN